MMNTKRRLVGLAAGAALSAGAAQAQSSVQIYGVVDLYLASKQLASATGTRTTNVDSGGMTTSHWGLRGTEDLGGGLKASFDASGFIRADTGESGRFPNDAYFSRTASVGLQGGFGTVRMGRLTTPNFISTIRLNPFGDSTVFNPITLHTYVGGQPLDAAIASGGPAGVSDSAHNNSIAYSSPNWGGLSATLNHSLGEAVGGGNKRTGYALTYGSGPLLVSFSGEHIDQPAVPPPPAVPAGNQKQGQDTRQLGASYDFGTLRLFGQWSRTTVDLPAAASRDFTTWQLGTSVPVGAGRIMASVATTRKTESALAEIKRTTWALGYSHALSKRTELYGAAMRDSVTALQSGTSLGIGIRHRF